MYSNLDNFLNAKKSYPEPENDLAAEPAAIEDLNDSEDLNFTLSETPKSQPKQRESKPFVPAKGQKGAVKRWNKIKEQAEAELAKLASPEESDFNAQKQKKKQLPQSSPDKSKPMSRSTRTSQRPTNTNSRAASRYVTHEIDSDSPILSEDINIDGDVITFDCDDDLYRGLPSVQINRNLAGPSTVSQQDDKISVKVKVLGKFEDYVMPKYQKFIELVKEISTKKSIPVNHIKLMFRNKLISSGTESPHSIDYVRGLIIAVHIDSGGTVGQRSKDANKDKLEIKIQSKNKKKPFIVYIGKEDKLINLAYECAGEFKCDPSKVRLEFDGEMIDFNSTVADLELDGGEQMDFFEAK